MEHKKLLVTGAAGMVGSYVSDAFKYFKLVLTDIVKGYEYLNIEDKTSVERLISAAKPDYVLHLAAATDVDKCQVEPDWAFKVNAEGTKNMAVACKKSGSTMIYVSTTNVFDGKKKKPYIETDKPSPINKYGLSKYEGEKIVGSLLEDYYIVRAGWMIGGGINDKKFVGKIVNKIMSGEKELKVVNDKFGSITYAKDFLLCVRRLVDMDKFGLYHIANGGMYSRYEIAKEVFSILGKKGVRIIPVSSDEFPMPAPRGRSEALENYNLNRLGLNCMMPWKKALREYITKEIIPLYNN